MHAVTCLTGVDNTDRRALDPPGTSSGRRPLTAHDFRGLPTCAAKIEDALELLSETPDEASTDCPVLTRHPCAWTGCTCDLQPRAHLDSWSSPPALCFHAGPGRAYQLPVSHPPHHYPEKDLLLSSYQATPSLGPSHHNVSVRLCCLLFLRPSNQRTSICCREKLPLPDTFPLDLPPRLHMLYVDGNITCGLSPTS